MVRKLKLTKKEDNKQQTILGNLSIFLKEVATSDAITKF